MFAQCSDDDDEWEFQLFNTPSIMFLDIASLPPFSSEIAVEHVKGNLQRFKAAVFLIPNDVRSRKEGNATTTKYALEHLRLKVPEPRPYFTRLYS